MLSDAPNAPVEDEEFKGVPAQELKSAESWSHQRSLLLKQGRYVKWAKPESNEEEEADAKAEENPEDAEEEVSPLRSLNEDAAESKCIFYTSQRSLPNKSADTVDDSLCSDVPACWSFRVAPTPDATSSAAFPHAVAVAQSLVWPGAVAAAQSGI